MDAPPEPPPPPPDDGGDGGGDGGDPLPEPEAPVEEPPEPPVDGDDGGDPYGDDGGDPYGDDGGDGEAEPPPPEPEVFTDAPEPPPEVRCQCRFCCLCKRLLALGMPFVSCISRLLSSTFTRVTPQVLPVGYVCFRRGTRSGGSLQSWHNSRCSATVRHNPSLPHHSAACSRAASVLPALYMPAALCRC